MLTYIILYLPRSCATHTFLVIPELLQDGHKNRNNLPRPSTRTKVYLCLILARQVRILILEAWPLGGLSSAQRDLQSCAQRCAEQYGGFWGLSCSYDGVTGLCREIKRRGCSRPKVVLRAGGERKGSLRCLEDWIKRNCVDSEEINERESEVADGAVICPKGWWRPCARS